jgi:glucokinase
MHLLFDIGGTTMRLAALRGEHFEVPIKLRTPATDIGEAVRLLADSARKLAAGDTIESAAGGIAGVFDRFRRTLARAPHLPGWVGTDIVAMLEEALGTSVVLDNDAAVVGLGEAHAGAGRGSHIMAYVTISTGVGGARIKEGTIDAHTFGFEPGHQVITLGQDVATISTTPGRLEEYISGTAFSHRYSKPAFEVQEKAAWEAAAYFLAVGLNNLAVFWSPDVIVLGGSMMVGVNGPTIPLELVQRHFTDLLQIFPKKPILRLATLGDEGGLYGAQALLKQQAA